MARIAAQNLRLVEVPSLIINSLSFHNKSPTLPLPWRCPYPSPYSCPSPYLPRIFPISNVKKKNSQLEPVLKPSTIKDVAAEEVEEEDDDVIEDGVFTDDDFEDLYEAEEAELYAGDGGGGGGISLAGTSWDKEALSIAEEVLLSFDGDLKIYAFKTLANSTIQVRIEKLSNKSGSPNMSDIEGFSSAYRERLDGAVHAGTIPENVSLEVSSPGVERVVRIPEDLDRFKDRSMYVKYFIEAADETGSSLFTEGDGVFRLVSFDLESRYCTWGIADVRINRDKAGKGRPLNKKQRDWRLNTPFQSLRLVRLFSDV